MVHSIEAYCLSLVCLRTKMVYAGVYVLLIQSLLLSLLSNSVSAHSVFFFFVHVRSETRSSLPRKRAHEILMTVTFYNINSQVAIKGREEVALSEVFNWISSKIKVILNLLQSRYNSVNSCKRSEFQIKIIETNILCYC